MEHLQREISSGRVTSFDFESLKFRLADKTWYTPDFIVHTDEGYIEAHEVKGFLRDDAAVKFKVVAELFPWIRWIMVRKLPKKDGGGFTVLRDI